MNINNYRTTQNLEYNSFKDGCKFFGIDVSVNKETTEGKSKAGSYTEYKANIVPIVGADSPLVRTHQNASSVNIKFRHYHEKDSVIVMFRNQATGYNGVIFLDCWTRKILSTVKEGNFNVTPNIAVNVFGNRLKELEKEAMNPDSNIEIQDIIIPHGEMNVSSQWYLTDLLVQYLIDQKVIDGKAYNARKDARIKAAQAKRKAENSEGREIDTTTPVKEVDAVKEDKPDTVEVEHVDEETQLP